MKKVTFSDLKHIFLVLLPDSSDGAKQLATRHAVTSCLKLSLGSVAPLDPIRSTMTRLTPPSGPFFKSNDRVGRSDRVRRLVLSLRFVTGQSANE